ncbi:MAG: PLP-dependent cysteine synthase family protein [Pseudobdellovibrionaceae bacterium]
MKSIYNNLVETIGSTPIVRLNKVIDDSPHQFYVKLEYFNPGGSVKDRVATALIAGAEKRGQIQPGGTIIEATSGNTGLGLAMVAAIKGYKCIFVMPDKISEEKRAVLRAYGAKVVITPTGVEADDPRSYYQVAKTLVAKTPNCFYANQYYNPDNPQQHYETTGPEIWAQTHGDFDVFVGGAGTGGTMTGLARYLKEKKPSLKIICADPVGSILYDLYYHGKIIDPPKPYKVEGVGEDILPDNIQLKLYDGFERVSDLEAFLMTRRLIREEGICVGPSSALALVGAIKYSKKLESPQKILVMMPDNGKGYLSKVFNDQWMIDNGFLANQDLSKTFNQIISADQALKELKD